MDAFFSFLPTAFITLQITCRSGPDFHFTVTQYARHERIHQITSAHFFRVFYSFMSV